MTKNVSVIRQCFTIKKNEERDVKCVVVGDTAVGKTKLIRAYACNLPKVDISDVNSHKHLPSIVALDNCQNIADNQLSLEINNVNVNLKIWDTFGGHEKNREYSYCNADVVIIAFSIGQLQSLNNVVTHWYPEVKCFCSKVPIILVGTQYDRRHNDPSKYVSTHRRIKTLGEYLGLKSNSVLLKEENKLVEPEIGRTVASSINAHQYIESSIVTKYGVNNVFFSAAKAAVMTKHTCSACHSPLPSQCLIQKPFLPSKRFHPEIKVSPVEESTFFNSLFSPYVKCDLHDVTFHISGFEIYAHAAILMCASCLFHELLLYAYSIYFTESSTGFSPDTELQKCIRNDEVDLYLPRGFVDISMDEYTNSVSIALDGVTVQQFVAILQFFYTSEISCLEGADLLLEAACYLQLPLVSRYILNSLNKDIAEAMHVQNELSYKFAHHGKELLACDFFSDLKFTLESKYKIPVHKAILTERCKIMHSMFHSGHFIESQRSEVDFRDTNLESFLAVLEYLYTGDCKEHIDDLHGTLQLANFLCLPRLVTFCEDEIVNKLKEMDENENQEVYSTVIGTFICAQYHNAPQLAAWCSHFMSTNYNALCKESGKEMKLLDDETLKYLEENRWPPVWYLKEQDYYERSMKQLEKEQSLKKSKRRKRSCRSCFFT